MAASWTWTEPVGSGGECVAFDAEPGEVGGDRFVGLVERGQGDLPAPEPVDQGLADGLTLGDPDDLPRFGADVECTPC